MCSKIRCDGKSWKILQNEVQLNRAPGHRPDLLHPQEFSQIAYGYLPMSPHHYCYVYEWNGRNESCRVRFPAQLTVDNAAPCYPQEMQSSGRINVPTTRSDGRDVGNGERVAGSVCGAPRAARVPPFRGGTAVRWREQRWTWTSPENQ